MQLYLNTLYVIANTEKDLELIYAIFSLRLLSIIGFRPNINDCKICGQKEKISHFSIKDNTFKCQECAKQDKGAIKISATAVDAIRYIILSDAKKIFSFSISDEAKKDLILIAKLYLTEKLEKEYKF